MNTYPNAATEAPQDPEETEPLTTPPLEPEEKPIVVRDHGVESDEEQDVDKAAGDEGIDDDAGDDFDKNNTDEK